MDKKVSLINIVSTKVNQIQMPIGLGVLSNSLKLHNIESKLVDLLPVDAENREQYFKEQLFDEPAIYGFGIIIGNNQLNEVERYAQKILDKNKDNIIVYGGPLPSSIPKMTLENCLCDYVIKGEAEISFPRLIKSVSEGNLHPKDIEGVYYLENGETIGKPNKMIRKLDKYSQVDYSKIDMDFYVNYLKETNQSFEIMASRGCPYNCSFCYKVCGQGVSVREPDDVLDEIKFIQDNYDMKKFFFIDENFFQSRKFFKGFIKGKRERGMDFTFIAQSRIDSFDRDLCIEARDNGLTCISFAIESASQETLDRINKKTNIKDIEHKLDMLYELGIRFTTEFIIGFEWDTIKGYGDLIDFMKKNKLEGRTKLSYLTPLPSTQVYKEALDKRLIKDEFKYIKDTIQDLYWERIINFTKFPDEVLDFYYQKISKIGERKVSYPKSEKYLKKIKKIY